LAFAGDGGAAADFAGVLALGKSFGLPQDFAVLGLGFPVGA
jgi:hypothetical protein